jgi:hypothetical protein
MRFSGHDTFACRTTWLYKGIDFLNSRRDSDNQLDISKLNGHLPTIDLGVGKNMVNAIKHWLLAFGVINAEQNDFGVIASLIYTKEDDDNNLDAFIEDKFTLWILHHEICTREYASIYSYFFKEYFKRKSTRTFSENEFVGALTSYIKGEGEKLPSIKSLSSDFRCLIDTYCIKKSKKATLEDNYTTLLTELNLIRRTEFRSGDNEVIFELNTQAAENENTALFGALILKTFGKSGKSSVSLDDVYLQLGTILLLNRDAFSKILEKVAATYSLDFSFKQNDSTGIQELQINTTDSWIVFAKKHHYEAC